MLIGGEETLHSYIHNSSHAAFQNYSRALAAESTADALSIPLAPGGALVLYRTVGSPLVTLSPTVQRTVLADLTLPLERNRLIALVQHVGDRARATGRSSTPDSTKRAEM